MDSAWIVNITQKVINVNVVNRDLPVMLAAVPRMIVNRQQPDRHLCEHNTEGYHCEQCKRGFYGDAARGTPFDCTPCPCPGASDCFLDAYGQVQCRNCPAGLTGRLCEECAPGYTRSRSRLRIDEGRICEPIGHVEETNIVFVPTPEGDRIYRPRFRLQRSRLQRNRHYYLRRKLHY
ncbi:unnamed protein product [Onchocerca ochengi]|uniref:Laminin EGF-like domain-containing protein n=1 Tax=Onchocerca ochengi TaxID=42157 RepID=A0A182EHV0_ONCOC|nr:unnamed protein product [Onchocerca ochengi]